MLDDFYAVFERYSIMTEQPDVTKIQALLYIKKNTTEQLFNKLLEEIEK